MTTNNPEVVAWRWRKPVVNDQGETVGVTDWKLSETPEFLSWWTNEPLVRLSDYEALQAEYEQLSSYTKNGIECFANPCSDHSGVNTPPFSEFQERYGQLCLMCVVDERDVLLVAAEQQPDITQLVEALERIKTWPDGGRHYGQSKIKVFAAEALAAYRKGAES